MKELKRSPAAFFCARIRKVHSSTEQTTFSCRPLSHCRFVLNECCGPITKPIAASLGSPPIALISGGRGGWLRRRADAWTTGGILLWGGFTMCVVRVAGYFEVCSRVHGILFA